MKRFSTLLRYTAMLCILSCSQSVLAQAPSSNSLKETGYNQKRDISIPGSRIVLNPYNFTLDPSVVPAVYSNSPALPLNAGYLHTQFTNRDIENLLGIYHVRDNSGPGEIPGWAGNLADTSAWQVDVQASIQTVVNGLKMTVNATANPAWQYMQTYVQANIDPTAVFKITIPQATGGWSIKLKPRDGSAVKVLRGDTTGTGSFEYNIQQLTGWSGLKAFDIQFFSIGQSSVIVVSDLRVVYKNTATTVGWTGDLSQLSNWISPNDGAGASWSVSGGQLTFNATSGAPYFKTKDPVSVNLNTTPTLKITVPAATGKWSVKVNDGSGDIAIRPDSAGAGVFYLNIPRVTGWTGTKSFDIKIYSVSYGVPTTVTVSSMQLTSDLSVVTAWSAPVGDPGQWTKSTMGTTIEAKSTGIKFSLATVNALSYFRTATPVTINVDKTPKLLLNIPEAAGPWSVKVNDGVSEVALQPDTRSSGSFEYDLQALTGWSGVKTFNIVFYVIPYKVHPPTITVGSIRIAGSSGTPSLVKAAAYSTAWTPHDLPFTATYTDSATLSGYDYFYDEHTLVRNISFDNVTANNGQYVLAGSYAGAITYADGTIRVARELYSYALSAAAFSGKPVKYYASAADMQAGTGELSIPAASGYWAIAIDANALSGHKISIATAFAGNSDTASLASYLSTPLTGSNAITGHASRQLFWDNFLASVPHPSRFDIQAVDTKGVTTQQVKDAYYKAFVFTAASVLGPDPGVFNYPQIAGKASLWDEGAEEAPFSATWDSFTAMQQYAYIDPSLAWDAFKGLMSLTDASGVIAGESLPSRKAQTAWQLFQMNKDTASLSAVYAPLERYLNWRIKYPLWVYYTTPDTLQKDAEFVFSALVDLAYMRDISKIVMNEDTAAIWEQKRINFYEASKSWFWATPSAKPVQYYNTASHLRVPGNAGWVTTGFYVDLLTGDQLTGMNNLFNDNFGSAYNFYQSGVPKYPDLSYTVYGLIARGNKTAAEAIVDASIRETVLANMFSEVYNSVGATYPWGVRPSLFGANQVIDFVWLKNGFDYDKGFPHVVKLFDGTRGVSNLNFDGRTLNIVDNNGSFTFTGSFLNQPSTSLTLDSILVAPVPLGIPCETPAKHHPAATPFLKLYPNPARDYINISFSLNKTEKVWLNIFDQSGHNMDARYQQLSQGNHTIIVDTQRYPAGVYIVSLGTRSTLKTVKFVKVH